MNKSVKKYFRFVLGVAGILFFVLACMYHTSCRITPQGITLITNETECAKVLGFSVEKNKISVKFSQDVKVEQCFAVESSNDKEKISSIENILNSKNKIPVEFIHNSPESEIIYIVKEKTKLGQNYDLYSVVRDKNGSSLTFALPFVGENDHLALVILSEVNEAYSKKDGSSEYIELYVLESGNLAGLELISCSDEKHFELPAVEVEKGEYVLVHLRLDPTAQNAITETGTDLTLSKAQGSSLSRDIWIKNEDSALNSTAEIIILNNKATKQIVDCVMYCKKEYADLNANWKNKNLEKYAQRCKTSNLWSENPTPQNAVFSTERKSISYISRTNIHQIQKSGNIKNGADCWTGTSKSKTSPGKPNVW